MKRKTGKSSDKLMFAAYAQTAPIAKTRLHPTLKRFVGFCYYKSAAIFRGKVDQRFHQYGLVAPQFGMLVILVENGPLTQGELGQYLAIDKATMVRMIDNLQDKKLVTRTQSKTDRRANHLEITKAGEKMLTKLNDERKKIEDEFFSVLTKEEREQLAVLTDKLITAAIG
ncbi:MAG: MarR family winged helix-turn-helix transcriptional regulator [Bdellovibrionales bacterium]